MSEASPFRMGHLDGLVVMLLDTNSAPDEPLAD